MPLSAGPVSCLKLVKPAPQTPRFRRKTQRTLDYFAGETFRQGLEKQWHARPRLRGKPHADGHILVVSVDTRLEILQHVDFIHHQQRRDLVGVDFFEHGINRLDILRHADIRRVDHMQQQRRLTRLLQRGFKRRDQIVRQMADKPYRIRQHRFADVRDVYAAQRRVECREQLIRCIHLSRGDLVKQGGFAGVGVAHQRDGGNIGFGSRPTSLLSLLLDALQAREDLSNTVTQ